MRGAHPEVNAAQRRSTLDRRFVFVLAILILGGLTASGCEPPNASPVTSQIPAVSPGFSPALANLTDDELAAARQFREEFGLRSDDAWIRQVAADPSSDLSSYGVPLSPNEISELKRRREAVDAIRTPVIGYSTRQPDYAGSFIDQRRGGIFVVQFKGNVEVHRSALAALVGENGNLEVRQVRWSSAELERYSDQLVGQDVWFRSIGAYLTGFGPNVELNQVEIQVSSVDNDLGARISEHFGWPAALVRVVSDGTGALLLGTGEMRILAIDGNRKPVAGLACVAVPDLPGAYEPRPVPMPTTNTSGECMLTLPSTGYWIRLERGEAPPTLVAIGRAVVVEAQRTEVTIEVP